MASLTTFTTTKTKDCRICKQPTFNNYSTCSETCRVKYATLCSVCRRHPRTEKRVVCSDECRTLLAKYGRTNRVRPICRTVVTSGTAESCVSGERCFFQHVVQSAYEANLIVPVPKSHETRMKEYVVERWNMTVVASEHVFSNGIKIPDTINLFLRVPEATNITEQQEQQQDMQQQDGMQQPQEENSDNNYDSNINGHNNNNNNDNNNNSNNNNNNLLAVAHDMMSEPIVQRVLSRIFIVNQSALTLEQATESLMANEFAATITTKTTPTMPASDLKPRTIRIISYPKQNTNTVARALWHIDTLRSKKESCPSNDSQNGVVKSVLQARDAGIEGVTTTCVDMDIKNVISENGCGVHLKNVETGNNADHAEDIISADPQSTPRLLFTPTNAFDTLVYVLQSADGRYYFGVVSVPVDYSEKDRANLASGTVAARQRIIDVESDERVSTRVNKRDHSPTRESSNSRVAAPVCRAWLKINEAIARAAFKSADHIRGNALDIGASPGGWSYFLADTCDVVIAVDPGKLTTPIPRNVIHMCAKAEDCVEQVACIVGASTFRADEIASLSSSSASTSTSTSTSRYTYTSSVDVHLPSVSACDIRIEGRIDKFHKATERSGLDVLVCDMNCSPQTMLMIAVWPFAHLLNRGAGLVLTCKAFTDRAMAKGGFEQQVKAVVRALEPVCEKGSIQVIHLMSNREMERTVIARWHGLVVATG